MNRIQNQLNKVKNFSESSSKRQSHDIDSKAATDLIRLMFLSENSSLDEKTVAVLNSKSGIIHIGISLLNPMYVVSIFRDHVDSLLNENLNNFNVSFDCIKALSQPFYEKVFDVTIVAPQLDKCKITDLSEIKTSIFLSKKTYFCFKSDHKNLIYEKYPKVEEIGCLLIKMPGTSEYHKQKSNLEEFSVFRL